MSAAIRRAVREALAERERQGLLRRLKAAPTGVDFCSNDYLGLARDRRLRERVAALASSSPGAGASHGATGSRLISGNHPAIVALESQLADFYQAEAALVFSSGFAANLGLLASLGGVADTLLCDRLLHASAIDGGRLSGARRIIFAHNDMQDLKSGLERLKPGAAAAVVVESLYSMEGDFAPLAEIVALADSCGAGVVVDEAHVNGVAGPGGRGAVVAAGLADRTLARVVTFGKALGLGGGAVLCSAELRDYLVNFARSLVFSTALSPLWARFVQAACGLLPKLDGPRGRLRSNVAHFRRRAAESPLAWLPSESWIQSLLVPGAAEALRVGEALRRQGLAALPIRAPSVPPGRERIRVCLHAHNTPAEIDRLFSAVEAIMRPAPPGPARLSAQAAPKARSGQI